MDYFAPNGNKQEHTHAALFTFCGAVKVQEGRSSSGGAAAVLGCGCADEDLGPRNSKVVLTFGYAVCVCLCVCCNIQYT